MIRTRDLVEFLGYVGNVLIDSMSDEKYRREIIKRLRAYDKLLKEIKSRQKRRPK